MTALVVGRHAVGRPRQVRGVLRPVPDWSGEVVVDDVVIGTVRDGPADVQPVLVLIATSNGRPGVLVRPLETPT